MVRQKRPAWWIVHNNLYRYDVKVASKLICSICSGLIGIRERDDLTVRDGRMLMVDQVQSYIPVATAPDQTEQHIGSSLKASTWDNVVAPSTSGCSSF